MQLQIRSHDRYIACTLGCQSEKITSIEPSWVPLMQERYPLPFYISYCYLVYYNVNKIVYKELSCRSSVFLAKLPPINKAFYRLVEALVGNYNTAFTTIIEKIYPNDVILNYGKNNG